MSLKSEMLLVKDITHMHIKRMFQLMEEHYDNINLEHFENDLMEKNSVLILNDENDVIQGFTTIKIIDIDVDCVPVRLAFSGDTIINKEFWGELELHRAWIRAVYSQVSGSESEPYWLLISKGYKTYRFLPVYFRSFYPCYKEETPTFEKRIIDVFCKNRYPEYYNEENGIICLNGEKDALKSGIADISEKRLKDPHVKFFVDKNPGYINGDELVCLTKLIPDNMKPMVLRYLREIE